LKNRIWIISIGFFLVLSLLLPAGVGVAQETSGEGPVYIVQEGDSLWDIALRFRVSMDELARANGISDPGQLTVGARLVIPGLEGVQGVLTTQAVPFGETLNSLSRRYQAPVDVLVQLNHLTNPDDLYAGSSLVVPQQEEVSNQTIRTMLIPGQSLLELAVIRDENPWSYVLTNNLDGTWSALPGDIYHISSEGTTGLATGGAGALPGAIEAVDFHPIFTVQGKVASLFVRGEEGINLGGSFIDKQLSFFSGENGEYISLQGVHAMTEPGLHTLTLTGNLPDSAPYFGAPFAFSQSVLVRNGDYPFDPVLTVSPETIDPAVTKPEDAQWAALTATYSPIKLWDGVFQSPAPPPFSDCWPSSFGNRRSYNGSAYSYFHTGLDFCGGVGIEILAPASGVVIFAGPLTVRGNATVIDHGWGVFSGYLHQSEILVAVGDTVEPGQIIGLVGGTGRVTGPHLHWEIWAGGVQVDPMDWLEGAYPPDLSTGG